MPFLALLLYAAPTLAQTAPDVSPLGALGLLKDVGVAAAVIGTIVVMGRQNAERSAARDAEFLNALKEERACRLKTEDRHAESEKEARSQAREVTEKVIAIVDKLSGTMSDFKGALSAHDQAIRELRQELARWHDRDVRAAHRPEQTP